MSCDRLDEYLDFTLVGEERTAFLGHLESCTACRLEVEESGRLARLIREGHQTVPDGLADRVRQRIHGSVRRRLQTWAASAAAALVAAFGLMWLIFDSAREQVGPSVIVETAPTAGPPSADDRANVQVTFAPDAAVIAVPMKTSSPNVTIIWVYPATRAAVAKRANASETIENHERNEP